MQQIQVLNELDGLSDFDMCNSTKGSRKTQLHRKSGENQMRPPARVCGLSEPLLTEASLCSLTSSCMLLKGDSSTSPAGLSPSTHRSATMWEVTLATRHRAPSQAALQDKPPCDNTTEDYGRRYFSEFAPCPGIGVIPRENRVNIRCGLLSACVVYLRHY